MIVIWFSLSVFPITLIACSSSLPCFLAITSTECPPSTDCTFLTSEGLSDSLLKSQVFPWLWHPSADFHQTGGLLWYAYLLCHTDSWIECNAQYNDKKIDKNLGRVPVIVLYISLCNAVFFIRISYHSIVSTGWGCSFIVMLLIFPFFISITRSAIGAIARLCVITTTVFPFLWQVSCNNFKIDFPVW